LKKKLTKAQHSANCYKLQSYHDEIHPVVPPDKMYEGLVDGGDWFLVETYSN